MRSYDAIVIGGGPAGSTCAGALREQGLQVVLLDKARFPRDKVCAGWITPGVVRALALDVKAYGEHHLIQPLRAFRTGLLDGPQHETRYGEVVSYGIRRREFDHYLLQRANVRLRLGDPVHSIRQRLKQWVVNDELAAPLLIGAGGHFCPVARYLGRCGPDTPSLVVAQEIEFPMSAAQQLACAIAPDRPELFFCQDLKGYGWAMRKGSYLNIGLGREDSRHLSQHLVDFCARLQARGKLPPEMPMDFKGHAYHLWGQARRRLLAPGMLLIGDAAGMATPQSGEGIGPAIESAQLAASVVQLARGDYRFENLYPYVQALRQCLGKPPASLPTPPLLESLRSLAGRALMGSAWFNHHVVLDRWFLGRASGLRPAGAQLS
jgi:geranylgeranyl reductase family protein